MPANLVVNRSARGALRRTNLYVAPATAAALAERAKQLHVSVGSLADTALQMLVALPPDEAAALLRMYGHLNDDQHEIVRGFAAIHTIDAEDPDGADLLDGYDPPSQDAEARVPDARADDSETWAGPITPNEALEALALL